MKYRRIPYCRWSFGRRPGAISRQGPLRDALSKLSRIPLERQAGKNPPGMALPTYRSRFDFTCTIGAQKYIFTPGFDAQNKLTVIGVRLASS